MGKFRVKKWYQEYYGYHDIEAADQDEALQIEQDVLHDEGLDPDDFHIEAEPIEEAFRPPQEGELTCSRNMKWKPRP